MSFRKSGGNERALAEVLDEVRRAAPPELDWEQLEVRLERAAFSPAPEPVSRRRPLFALTLLPVAAALVAALLFIPRQEPSPAPVAPVAHADAKVDGDQLSAEDLLASLETPIDVVHPGRARWTLEPNSRAEVLEHGGIVRVRLIAGAMKAEVVPSPEPERFVVEAAGSRVAVHGTVFRVRLQGERTLVDVEQGVVSVSSRERPRLNEVLLRAPTHGEFTLEGSRLAPEAAVRTGAGPLRMAHPSHHESAVASSELPALDAGPEAEVRTSLTIGEAEAGVAAVVTALNRCFTDNTEGSHTLSVSARTELTLVVSPDGAVTEVGFTPPLSPAVQSCGEREALAVLFAPSSEGAKLTRVLDLSR